MNKRHHTQETRQKISLSLIGHKRSEKSKQRQSKTMKGKKRQFSNGFRHGKCCEFPICQNCDKQLGNYYAKLCRKCLGMIRKGKNNPNFKHGKCKNKNLYHIFKRKTDINYKMRSNLRSRLCGALKQKTKSKSTLQLLGCTISELKKHLEKTFTENMNWKNYGKVWEIDHIKPCCRFDLSKPEEQIKCFNYSNLQALTVSENRSKKDKY